jgi:glycolate dehydrogenase FAD-binding subunit
MSRSDPAVVARELGAIVGAARVRSPARFEARAAAIIVEPLEAAAVAELVRKCEADAITLAPMGAARTLARMRPTPVAVGVSLARMTRVLAYEPDDMTVIAEAGLTLAVLNDLAAAHGQRLPADPVRPEHTTLGALVAAAQAGPLRLSEGTVRDLLIGVRFAGHGGRMIHGGGQVVKNVAGYDLMKVMVGSFGTLGIITETTFKMRPIPQLYTLVTTPFADLDGALSAVAALHGAVPLIHLEVVSAAVAKALGHAAGPQVLAGCAGSAEEVEYLLAQARAILGSASAASTGAEAAAAYHRLRDFEANDAALVAQIAVAPAELAQSLMQCGAEFRAHAGSGVAQLFTGEVADADVLERTLTRWRGIARAGQGNLRVLRVPEGLNRYVSLFDDPAPSALALMRRVKATFDPHRVFNPGCFVGGL